MADKIKMQTEPTVILQAIEYRFNCVFLKFSQADNDFEIIVEKDSDLLDTLEVGMEYDIDLTMIKT